MPEKRQFQEDWEQFLGPAFADRIGRVIRNSYFWEGLIDIEGVLR